MRVFKKFRFALAVLGVSVLVPTAGMASTCGITDVTTSTNCLNESGNNENQNLNTLGGGLFGITHWTEVAASVESNGTVGPLDLKTGAGTQSGTWSVTNFTGVIDAMLIVKAGDNFAAYLLNILDTSGTWSTAGLTVGNGQQPNLSHLALYEVTATPIPGALWLFGTVITGAAGLGGWRRKRKNAAALAAA
jgi:hypothetical protein